MIEILIHGDCLKEMENIKDRTVDLILCDLPYGKTASRWDKILPNDLLWKQYKRIIKYNRPIVLFGTEPFSSMLRTSNLKWYKYDWIWVKDKPTNHLNADKQPMRANELISVFYEYKSWYYPIIEKKILKT